MTMPGTMPRGGPATVQKVVHASSRKANYSMRHTAGRQRQCQGSSPSPPPCALRRRAVSLRGEDPRLEERAAGGSEPRASQSEEDLKRCVQLAVLQVPGTSTSGPRSHLPLEKCARGCSARNYPKTHRTQLLGCKSQRSEPWPSGPCAAADQHPRSVRRTRWRRLLGERRV